MPVTTERLPDEPIIVATLSGHVDAQAMLDMWKQSAELSKDIDGHVYRITNVLAIETTFSEFVQLMKQAALGLPGSVSDPNVTAVLVGSSHWAKLFSGAIEEEQFGAMHIPIFESMHRALSHIRSQITTAKRNDQA